MLRQDVVFVLGAGVSAELGLPSGWELKRRIADLLPTGKRDGDRHLRESISNAWGEAGFQASALLKGALPLASSVDSLVEHYCDNETVVGVAKMGIAAAILKSEIRSSMGPEPDFPHDPFDSSIGDIFQLVVGQVRNAQLDLALSRLVVVNFNYDRCLEFLLCWAIQQYSGQSIKRAAELFAQATILHPYGSLGHFAGPAKFGRPIAQAGDLSPFVQTLQTFSEGVRSDSGAEIKAAISRARIMVFLGCAHHPQNLELLRPAARESGTVYATVYNPAPVDPHRNSNPGLSEFSGPAMRNLIVRLKAWKFREKASSSAYQVEALTNRQMIAKYGRDWVE